MNEMLFRKNNEKLMNRYLLEFKKDYLLMAVKAFSKRSNESLIRNYHEIH
jgi:hypothetical protein